MVSHDATSAIDIGLHWARHAYSVHVGNRGRDRCCVDVLAAAGGMGKAPLVEGVPARAPPQGLVVASWFLIPLRA